MSTPSTRDASHWYARIGKRVLDMVIVSTMLVVTAPLLLLLILLVRLKLGSPVFFRQARPGRHGKLFTLLKFRTMTDGRDADGNLLPDGLRLTKFGRWLRSTSLDELPEIWNVLQGEMSLVGPRPLLPEYLDHYTAEQMRRHDVLPGITGWAQVQGRNATNWETRFQHDLWYVENQSLHVDLKILLLTPWKVVRREGVAAKGHVTMPKFQGSSHGLN